jgi:K+-transporting ATPase ATPase A chain
MTANGWLQIGLFFAVLMALVKPLGWYMARVYEGKPCGLDLVLGPCERALYRFSGIRSQDEMDWKAYGIAMLLFNGLGLAALYTLQRVQSFLPLNPAGLSAVEPDLAFNTAVSFATNTNWQAYGGETTLSYLTQMIGLTVQNFLSAATGMAILIALIRGLARRNAGTIGNFWVDLTRTVLYVLLPLSLVLAAALISQGTIQTFGRYQSISLVQPFDYDKPVSGADGQRTRLAEQVLAVGPAASQIAIKHLGTNGGGFFNANAAHPFESPTPFTDCLLILAEAIIAASLTHTFGIMVGDRRQGWTVLSAMLIVLAVCVAGAYWAECAGNPIIAAQAWTKAPIPRSRAATWRGRKRDSALRDLHSSPPLRPPHRPARSMPCMTH